MKKIIPFALLALATSVPLARAEAPFMPLDLTSNNGPIVDEPLGARSSLGLTLWHMGHDAYAINAFHEFLQKKKIKPEGLLAANIKAPATAARILLEPERLPADKLSGWSVNGEYLVSGAGDNGPTVDMPLRVARAGRYAGWVRYFGSTGGTGVTALRIYRAGRVDEGPILNDEIYDYAVEVEGKNWKHFMVDLAPGEYVMRLSHVVRWWHAGKGPAGYIQRMIDLIYLTDELGAEAPTDETLDALRATGAATDLEMTSAPALDDKQKAQWKLWQVRPISWEDSIAQPKLFALSREFWRQTVDAIGKNDYGKELPDYRAPERQIVFDDNWNLVANPVQIKRRVDALQSDLITKPSKDFWYWLQAGDFQKLEGGWQKIGTSLNAGYNDFGGVASTDFSVDQPGEYSVWVRFQVLNGYYANWTVTATNPENEQVKFVHDKNQYPSDWAKLGVLKMDKAGLVHFEITPQNLNGAGTYRNIYDFLLTTDADYTPIGDIRPPMSLAQYNQRAKASGATEKDPYLLWISENAYTPMVQEVGNDSSWPITAVQAAAVQKPVAPSSTKKLAMPTDTKRAVQVALRSLRGEPIKLQISGGDLKGAGGNFPNKVSWCAVGFVPQSEDTRNWSPYLVMRRPWITIPPRSVAGLWLTVDATGVPAGEYSSQVVLKGKGLPDRTITLQVQVAPAMEPREKVLVGGYTLPPEGEIYTRDCADHRMRIWYADMSKAEMKKRGIELIIIQLWEPDEAAIRARIERMKSLGLDFKDWIFSVKDEPGGATEEALKPYIDVAKAIHAVDPKARVSFNPGDSGTLATFQVLDPYCDFWLPYTHHRYYHPNEAAAKMALISAKPWMWYTTPDLWDKAPYWPSQIYNQIREVPVQPGLIQGTAFFAFYYPFRDSWDAAHEYLPDAGMTVLPSRHGPVATRAWEAVREGIQDADLARAARENLDPAMKPEEQNKLLQFGTTEELLKTLGF